jgi:hypothetical protein
MIRRPLWARLFQAAGTATLLVGVLASCGSQGDDQATNTTLGGDPSGGESSDGVGTTLSASLSGAGAGDPDASGTAYVGVDTATSNVCVDVRTGTSGALVSVLVRRGQASSAELPDAVVEISTPALSLDGRGCAPVPDAVASGMQESPGEFYVEVRTSEFPDGAARGQLRVGT